jgi:hypothetical protein
VRSEFIYAARARWRADLLDIGAAMHEAFKDAVTAGAKQAEAELHRVHADLLDAVGKAKDAYSAGVKAAVLKASQDDLVEIALGTKALGDLPGVKAVVDALHAVRDELRATEKRWREIDAFTGNRARNGIINNFTEPTDAELERSLS